MEIMCSFVSHLLDLGLKKPNHQLKNLNTHKGCHILQESKQTGNRIIWRQEGICYSQPQILELLSKANYVQHFCSGQLPQKLQQLLRTKAEFLCHRAALWAGTAAAHLAWDSSWTSGMGQGLLSSGCCTLRGHMAQDWHCPVLLRHLLGAPCSATSITYYFWSDPLHIIFVRSMEHHFWACDCSPGCQVWAVGLSLSLSLGWQEDSQAQDPCSEMMSPALRTQPFQKPSSGLGASPLLLLGSLPWAWLHFWQSCVPGSPSSHKGHCCTWAAWQEAVPGENCTETTPATLQMLLLL